VYAKPGHDRRRAPNHRDGDYSDDRRGPPGRGLYPHFLTTAYTTRSSNQTQDLFAVDNFFWNTLTGRRCSTTPRIRLPSVQQKSEELKIVSPLTGQSVSWLAGLFYSDSSVNEIYIRTLPPAGLDVHRCPR